MIEVTAFFRSEKLDFINIYIAGSVYTVKEVSNYYHTPDYWQYKVITNEGKIFDLKFNIPSFSWSVESEIDNN